MELWQRVTPAGDQTSALHDQPVGEAARHVISDPRDDPTNQAAALLQVLPRLAGTYESTIRCELYGCRELIAGERFMQEGVVALD